DRVPAAAACRVSADPSRDRRRRSARVHAIARRVHHHVLPDRNADHASDLHLYADQVRNHARGERARVDAARRFPACARARIRLAADDARVAPRRSLRACPPSRRESDSVNGLRLATAPVSWGIWEQTIDRSDLVLPRPLLEPVTAMGYGALETGPPGYFADNGTAAAELAAAFDVELVATFLPLRLDDEDAFREDLGELDRTTDVLAATGGGIV